VQSSRYDVDGRDRFVGWILLFVQLALLAAVFLLPEGNHWTTPAWLSDGARAFSIFGAEQLERRLVAGPAWVAGDYVFDRGDGHPIDPDALSKAFRLARGKLRLDRVRFHDVRHLFASMLVANGTNVRVVSDLLGHSTISFTLSVYVHPDEAAAVAAINDAERMLGG
jgi:integrase